MFGFGRNPTCIKGSIAYLAVGCEQKFAGFDWSGFS